MATHRLINPDPGRVEAALEKAAREANYRARTRTIFIRHDLARRILGEPEGVHQSDGGGGRPAREYGRGETYFDPADTSSLYVAWWTSGAGDKLVLIDGRRVGALASTPDSPRGVAEIGAKPEDAIRGWRKPKPRSLRVESSFGGAFADLGRLPDFNPTREALLLMALYGDESARGALHDYDHEHGGGKAP